MPMMDFYTALNKSFTAYLESNKSDNDLKTFKNAWEKEINKDENKALMNKPFKIEVADVFKTLLISLTVIGNIYLLIKAAQNFKKSRGQTLVLRVFPWIGNLVYHMDSL